MVVLSELARVCSSGVDSAHTVKKGFSIFPSRAGMSLTILSVGGNNDAIYKPRESLVCDIPAESGNIEKLFLPCKQIWPGESALFRNRCETGMRKSYAKVINKIYYLYRISQQVIGQMLINLNTAKLTYISHFLAPKKQSISLVNIWKTEIQES